MVKLALLVRDHPSESLTRFAMTRAAKRISPASAPKSDSNINSACISSDSIRQVLSESCAIDWSRDVSLAARNFARVPDQTPQPSPGLEDT
jgi:hypothetical protein